MPYENGKTIDYSKEDIPFSLMVPKNQKLRPPKQLALPLHSPISFARDAKMPSEKGNNDKEM